MLFLWTAALAALGPAAAEADLLAKRVKADLSKMPEASAWAEARPETVSLMGQPMVAPKPKETSTASLKVEAMHDGKWIAFRLRWADPRPDEAGKLGEFSDAVAIEFPVKEGVPPPVFMGGKDNPVHLFHWRAQYQRDAEKGKKDIRDIYPNMSIDMYPMEYKDPGKIQGLSDEKREQFAHGRAAGNPQSYAKSGVDEILAEGFGTTAVVQETRSYGKGSWKDGEWTVVIGRQMAREGASSLASGKAGNLGFAVWQGQALEVGSRKSVTMSWTPLKVEE